MRVPWRGVRHVIDSAGVFPLPPGATLRSGGGNPGERRPCLRNYELVYIADPELDEEQLGALEERVKSLIEGAGGKVLNVDRWGKRKLAYHILKRSEGYYILVDTELPPQAGAAIERDLKLNEQVLRYLLTLKTE